MRLLTSAVLTGVLLVSAGCALGQKSIVGKWDCKAKGVDYSSGQKDTFEYLADGTSIISIVYANKEGLSTIPPIQVAGQWKQLEGDRFSTTIDGKTNITTYKFEGEKLLFKSSSSDDYAVKCDRIK